ncbi:zinc-binding dehydrogenase [Streptomyces pseudovenezuelae]|uniref:zinc-binding dehydrogenase n=1 Tax=Streptomyces pseudovenezuelae TaxID=67350 RepID=UPI003D798C65
MLRRHHRHRGHRTLRDLRRALTPHGRLIITGGETKGTWLGGTDRQLRAQLLSPFTAQHLGTFIASEHADGLRDLTTLIDAGALTPVVDRAYRSPKPPPPSATSSKAAPRANWRSPCPPRDDADRAPFGPPGHRVTGSPGHRVQASVRDQWSWRNPVIAGRKALLRFRRDCPQA